MRWFCLFALALSGGAGALAQGTDMVAPRARLADAAAAPSTAMSGGAAGTSACATLHGAGLGQGVPQVPQQAKAQEGILQQSNAPETVVQHDNPQEGATPEKTAHDDGAAAQLPDEAPVNVNGRYIVESVDITGVEGSSISRSLRDDMRSLVGFRLDEEKIGRLIDHILRDFPDYYITRKVTRGESPGRVRLVFELEWAGRKDRFDLGAPRAVYSSRLGWTGEVEGTVRAKDNEFSASVLSDNEQLIDRFAGITAHYRNVKPGTSKVRLGFDFEDFHAIWNSATLAAVEAHPEEAGIYRARRNFQPGVTVLPIHGLTVGAGASFQRLEPQPAPGLPYTAAQPESANAVIGTLRYDRRLESSGPNSHRLGAGYSLRAAAHVLGSDYVYARHAWDFAYAMWHGPHRVDVAFGAGILNGRAPLYERFVLGNSRTLRGWTKYEVAPLGGARVVYESVEYRYRVLRVFYDAGAAWSRGQDPSAKHSVGGGFQLGEFAMLVAFPLRNGHVTPVFMAGLNL